MNDDKTNATKLHSLTQKSKTLYRHATQKPASGNATQPRKIGRSMDIARSKHVTHFAKHPTTPDVKPAVAAKPRLNTIPARHPLAARVEAIRSQAQINQTVVAQASAPKPAKVIKEEAIAEAFDKISAEKDKEIVRSKQQSKFVRTITFIIGLIIIISIGIYIYLNMPSLSVGIANAQAGISATYPEYRPDGYSIDGPVTYSDGQVSINFHANTGDCKYTINQSKSSWDSSAVKDQVTKNANGAVVNTFEERGLTIYTYGGNASWVNGGIKYSIIFSGAAPLSVDQIRRIATSL